MGERKNGSETGLSEGNTLPLTSRAFFFLAPMLLTSVCYARLSLQARASQFQVACVAGAFVSSRGCFDAPTVLPSRLETKAPATQAT